MVDARSDYINVVIIDVRAIHTRTNTHTYAYIHTHLRTYTYAHIIYELYLIKICDERKLL